VGRPKLIKVDVTDGRGLGGAKEKTVSVQTRIPDILAYRDTPGFAYLLMAANPEMPVSVLCRVLEAVGPHQVHPATWMYMRRGLFKVPELPSGVNERTVAFVEANQNLPSWKLRVLARQKGIKCSVAKLYRIRMAILYENTMESGI
jgi:hypothetical protein